MKTIQINAVHFFELLKNTDTSMWEIFSQMIDGEEKLIVFHDDQDKILFDYVLPATSDKLEEDRQKFAKEYLDKISGLN